MNTERQQRVQEAIWNWREDGVTAVGPSIREVRMQAALRILMMLAFAGIFMYFEFKIPAIIVLVSAVLTLAAALFSPTRLYPAMDRGANGLVRGLTIGLQWLIFPLIYFLFFAPFGTLFRRGSRGPMQPEPDAGQLSYWLPVTEKTDRKRQF